MPTKSLSAEYLKGLWDENPVFRQLLGMCPVLAVTNTGMNALAMGLATLFVLVMSSTAVSLIRGFVPKQVRIVTFILVIATFVTVVDYAIMAISLDLHKALGAFISLIVVNCLILGRAEAFASKNSPVRAALDALGMGLAASFVLILSSLVVASIKKLIPNQVRIASYIVVIATFVTVADRVMAAFFPPISKALGPYVPLIVVNCIILGRQEAFSSRNSVGRSLIDALGMSTGFVLALLVLSSIREILGAGTFLGYQVMGSWFKPWIIMILPAGAFITLGVLLGIALLVEQKTRERRVS